MFTGIIEDVGIIRQIKHEDTNRIFFIESKLVKELKNGDSVAHNGVCLTIEEIYKKDVIYQVTAVQETLNKTNLGFLKIDSPVNLERSLLVGSRLDGHFVTGHVDCTGSIIDLKDRMGSKEFQIAFPKKFAPYVIQHGSIAVDGISLTISNLEIIKNQSYYFFVNIIPHTWEHTNVKIWKINDLVNLEFDLIGKYIFNKELLNIQ